MFDAHSIIHEFINQDSSLMQRFNVIPSNIWETRFSPEVECLHSHQENKSFMATLIRSSLIMSRVHHINLLATFHKIEIMGWRAQWRTPSSYHRGPGTRARTDFPQSFLKIADIRVRWPWSENAANVKSGILHFTVSVSSAGRRDHRCGSLHGSEGVQQTSGENTSKYTV